MINGTTGESPTTTDAEKETAAAGRGRGGRRPGHRSSPASAPTTPHHTIELARAGGEGRRARPARRHAVLQQAAAGRACCSTSPRSPTPPACRCCSTTSRTAPASPIATETHGAGSPSTSGSSASRTPRATSAATSWVLQPHRPRVLLRRRRAHPAAAGRRRRSAWSAPRPTSPARSTKEMIEAYERGDVAEALRAAPAAAAAVHRHLPHPGHDPGQGRPERARACPAGPVRSPLVDATEAELAQLRAGLRRRRAARSDTTRRRPA